MTLRTLGSSLPPRQTPSLAALVGIDAAAPDGREIFLYPKAR